MSYLHFTDFLCHIVQAYLPVYALLLILTMDYGVPGADAQNDYSTDYGAQVRQRIAECAMMYENVTMPGIDPDFHCPPIFDGVICWPPAAYGDTVELPCPAQIDRYQTTLVHKTCLPSGFWAVQNLTDVYGELGECFCFHCFLLRSFTYLGYALSFTSCAIAFVIFMCSRTLRCTRNVIHWHLITSFMLKYMVYFIQPAIVSLSSVHPRRIFVFLLYYFEQTNYYWMFVEGLYLHTLVVFALRIDADKISFWVYCIIGWGIPMVFVGVWAIISAALNPDGDLINSGNDSTIVHEYACIIGPILLVLVINCFFLLNIVRLLMSKLRMHSNRSSDIKHYRRAARATLVLVILLGVGYILMICLPFLGTNLPPMGNLIFQYINNLLSGTQGLAVAIIYVFLNTEVRTVLRRKYRRKFGNSSPSCLFRKRAKPRTSSYSKYDDHSCMSTMRSMAHNDTVVDCYHDDDQGHRGRHQANRSGNGSAVKYTSTVRNGDTNDKICNKEKVEMELVKSNGSAAKWEQTEEGNDIEEAEPLLEEDGNPLKPTATIVISEATPVHTTAKGTDADYEDQQELHQPD